MISNDKIKELGGKPESPEMKKNTIKNTKKNNKKEEE